MNAIKSVPRNPNMLQDDASVEERPEFRESYTISPHKSKAAESDSVYNDEEEVKGSISHHQVEFIPVFTPGHESIE